MCNPQWQFISFLDGCFPWVLYVRHNTLFSEAQVVIPIKILHGFESKIRVKPTQHRADRKNQFLSEYCVFILSNEFERSKPHFSFTTGSDEWENASQPNSVVFKPLKVFYIARTYWYIFNKSKQLFIISTYLQINNYADKDRLLKCTTKYDEKVEWCLVPDLAGTCSILIWTAK